MLIKVSRLQLIFQPLTMKSSTINLLLPPCHLPSIMYPHRTTTIGAFPLKQWRNHTTSHGHTTHLNCHKMYVPGFGEASPEAKGAKHLHNFFTYVAVRIVKAQLESYNTEADKELTEFLEGHSLNDGDKFCAELMRESSRHKGLAMRILEVRSAYCKNDFEWDNLQRLAKKMVDESNTRIMRDYVLETSHVESEK